MLQRVRIKPFLDHFDWKKKDQKAGLERGGEIQSTHVVLNASCSENCNYVKNMKKTLVTKHTYIREELLRELGFLFNRHSFYVS